MNFIKEALSDSHHLLQNFLNDPQNIIQLEMSIATMVESIKKKGRILSCGNGGSLCDSMHFAEELTGRYRKNRPAISAISLSDPSHLTCVGNDFGYDEVFARGVEAHGREGDTLLVISTSGNSPNCLKAVLAAQKIKMKTVGLLGKDGGQLLKMVDIPNIVKHQTTDRIQEIHIKLIHIFIEGIERKIFPELY
jgi:D-sedoheptulose 7-phosphate isomerase